MVQSPKKPYTSIYDYLGKSTIATIQTPQAQWQPAPAQVDNTPISTPPVSPFTSAFTPSSKAYRKRWPIYINTCAACRASKTKCSRDRPICKRCEAYGRQCEYRERGR